MAYIKDGVIVVNWGYDFAKDENCYSIYEKSGRGGHAKYEIGMAYTDKDAALMAAAPELRQLLESLLETANDQQWKHYTSGLCSCKGCAIRKAKDLLQRIGGNNG